MSRTYSNFLLFEDVIDNLPTTSPIMIQALGLLLNPAINVVEEDCGTLLGQMSETSYELEGRIEVATGVPLSAARINTLLSQGVYKFGIRTLHTCISHLKGGICRKCYESMYIGETAPAVGTITSTPALQIYQSDVIIGNSYTQTFSLTQTEDDWHTVKVVHNGLVTTPQQYVLHPDSITFVDVPVSDAIHIVHFLEQNTRPFHGYIAKTYSGALLGVQPLPTLKLFLRESLYEAQFSENFINFMINDVVALRSVPSTYIDYLQRVHGKMEKVLLALYLFALYSNVEI